MTESVRLDMNFMDRVVSRAREEKKTIVLPEVSDRRVLEAASLVTAEAIADIIMIGDREKARRNFPEIKLDVVTFIEPALCSRFDEMVHALYELRKHKGMTEEEAKAAMLEPTTFGIMLVKMGVADGLVSGAAHTTADTLRPALQILKTKPGTKLVSAYTLMLLPACEPDEGKLYLMSDCALNVDPTDKELAEIAVASAETWLALTGTQPRVALLSYSSLGSGIGESPQKVARATQLARAMAPHILFDGELQVDAAIVSEVAAMKAGGSPVAGTANCLIFPDLNAGNIGYKLVERLANAKAYGPMLQGIAK
ncbi:MAG TPA: phosphate acetyltransferase, partial [Clostridia bacterium]|nr:phosphate acetyltransferase [Clostridia bacterium]